MITVLFSISPSCVLRFGHETVKRLDSKGYNVFAGCLTEEGEQALKACCSSRLKTVPLNVADPESVRKAFRFLKESLPPNQGEREANIAERYTSCRCCWLFNYRFVSPKESSNYLLDHPSFFSCL